jgi:hypothetical protein
MTFHFFQITSNNVIHSENLSLAEQTTDFPREKPTDDEIKLTRNKEQHFPSNGKMIDALHHHHHSQISHTNRKNLYTFFSISVKKLINFSSCLFSSSDRASTCSLSFEII